MWQPSPRLPGEYPLECRPVICLMGQQDLCHYGDCAPCRQLETVRCFCGEETKSEACGWKRNEERLCAKLFEDGEKQWAGRLSCGRPCEQLYDCGIHPCNEVSILRRPSPC